MPTALDVHRESSSAGTIKSPPVGTAHGPVLTAVQGQPTGRPTGQTQKREAPRANRKRAAVSFVPSKERLQAECRRWKIIRHAMLCRQVDCSQYRNGVCARMKDTLSHAAKCNNNKCPVVDCVGTRAMIKHMSQCRAKNCLVCGPAQQQLPEQSGTTVDARPTTPTMISEQEQQHQHQYGTRGSSPLKKRRVTLES
jgi:TAZ zinc finger